MIEAFGVDAVGLISKRVGTLWEVRTRLPLERTRIFSMKVLFGKVKMLRIGGLSRG